MPVPRRDDHEEQPADAWPSRARQWSRAALALAVVFASLPLAGWLFLGGWGFDGAFPIAGLCVVAAGYLHFAGREPQSPVPDSATMLDAATRLAASGDTAGGIALLDEALRLSPGFWQARQYRGQIHLEDQGAAESALGDFTEAIRLAPGEAHLYFLRSHVFTLLGREAAARADLETAARLDGDTGTPAVP
jgi:tetratricopeptide (TPR) repeat protein